MSSTHEVTVVEAAFAPMPLRSRSILENLDVAIKAYKQYFWVLVSWAALVNLLSNIPFVNYVTIFLAPPLIVGATCCCIAAAVRGQRVTFRQCWQFTAPRYWSVVALHILALILLGIAITIVLVAIVMTAAYAFSTLNEAFQMLPTLWQVLTAVVGGLLFLIFFSLLITALTAWQTMVSVVVCMEDDKRNVQAMSRAWELLRGHWKHAISLMMLLGMGMLALWIVLAATGASLVGLSRVRDMLSGNVTDANFWAAAIGFAFGSWLLLSLYTPIHYLAITLLYLDLRVRKEALDIEWTAHSTAPVVAVWEQNSPPSLSDAEPQNSLPAWPVTPQSTSESPPASFPQFETGVPASSAAPSIETFSTAPLSTAPLSTAPELTPVEEPNRLLTPPATPPMSLSKEAPSPSVEANSAPEETLSPPAPTEEAPPTNLSRW